MVTIETATRTETDRLGECAIPADVLWGIQTARSLENLSFSSKRLSDYPELIRNFALVKLAAARTNQGCGVIETAVADAIADACNELVDGKHIEQFPVDMLHGGGSIAFNMNVNEVIANLANRLAGSRVGAYQPVHPKQHVNASQSTADVSHTAFRLTVRELHAPLDLKLNRMIDVLRELSEKLKPVETISRTCMQDAMPVSMGELFGGFRCLIERRAKELRRAVDEASRINLGGTVIGTGDGASLEYRQRIVDNLSALVKRDLQLRDNLFDAAENADDLAAVSSQLEHLAQSLIKISADLRLLSSGPEAGFAEVHLPKVQEGSSFFSNKNNPVVPESVMNCCFQVIGNNRAAQAAIEHAELYLNVFENVAATNIMDSLRMLTNAVSLLTERCLSGIEPNEDRCASYAKLGHEPHQK